MSSAERKAPAPDKAPSSTSSSGRNARRANQSSKNAAQGGSKKFVGKTAEMQGHVFDVGAGRAKQFNDTHAELAEYIHGPDSVGEVRGKGGSNIIAEDLCGPLVGGSGVIGILVNHWSVEEYASSGAVCFQARSAVGRRPFGALA